MPAISPAQDGSSDEEIFVRKKPIRQKKFVDSDDENVSGNSVPDGDAAIGSSNGDVDSENHINNKLVHHTDVSKPKRRVIRRNDSDSDEERIEIAENSSSDNSIADHVIANKLVERKDTIKQNIRVRRRNDSETDEEKIEKVENSSEDSSVSEPIVDNKLVNRKDSIKHNRDVVRRRNSELHEEQYDSVDNSLDGSSVFDQLKTKRKQKENKNTSEFNEGSGSQTKEPQPQLPKPLFADKDLYDAESSDDESRATEERNRLNDSNRYDADASADEGSAVQSRNSEKQKSQKTKKVPKKNKKEIVDEIDLIHSESQRIVRESRVSLPYHRPRQCSLAEFLKRRPSTPSIANSVRMSVEELALMEQQLKQRAKQAEEFYKSSSEEDEAVPVSTGTDKPGETTVLSEEQKGSEKIKTSVCNEIVLPSEEAKCLPQGSDGADISPDETSLLLRERDISQGGGKPKTLTCNEISILLEENEVSQGNGKPNTSTCNEICILLNVCQGSDEPNTSTHNEAAVMVEGKDISQASDKSNTSIHNETSLLLDENAISQGHTKPACNENALLLHNHSEDINKSVISPFSEVIENSSRKEQDGVLKVNQLEFLESNWMLKDGSSMNFIPMIDDSTCAVPTEETKSKGDIINYDPYCIDSQDLVLPLSESMTDPGSNSSLFPAVKCKPMDVSLEQSASEKVYRFNFKKNLTDLLWKESWNSPGNVGQVEKIVKEMSDFSSLELVGCKGHSEGVRSNNTERARIMLEGENARSMCLDAFKETSAMTGDSNESKSQSEDARCRCEAECPRMMMEGENARSMCPENAKETNILAGGNSYDESKSQVEDVRSRSDPELPRMMMEGENARSMTLETGKETGASSGCKVEEKIDRADCMKLQAEDAVKISTEVARGDSNVENGVGNTPESRGRTKVAEKILSDSKCSETPETQSQDEDDVSKLGSASSMFFSKLLHGEGVLKSESLSEKSQDKSATPVTRLIPHLTGSPSKLIDLDATPSPCGVLALMNRFLKHSTMKKPKAEPTVMDISIVTAEQGENGLPEVKKESVTVVLGGGEETVQPGAKLQRLKQQLAQQMAQQREQEWNRRLQESQAGAEEELDEKSDCGLLDDEEELLEEDMTSSESEEEEEEEEDVVRPIKSRIRNAFVDDEAEVSDEDEGGISSDEDEEEIDEDEREIDKRKAKVKKPEAEESNSLQVSRQMGSELKRTRTFDPFESQEVNDSDGETQSVLDDADIALEIPPYQLGGALTPFLQPMVEERFVPAIITPTLPPGITSCKEGEGGAEELSQLSNLTPRLLGLCSGTDSPDTRDATETEIEAELLGLCSGKFLTQPVEPSQDVGLCSDKFSTTQGSQDFGLSLATQEGGGLSLSQPCESLPPTQPLPSSLLDAEVSQTSLHLKNGMEQLRRRPVMVIASSDEEDNNLFDERKKNKKKTRKKLEFSDDEGNESELSSDEEEARLIEYDSEENEIVVSKEEAKLPRLAKDFFENEAELSESEWGSADEDERDLDTLEWEEGDAEKLDQRQLKEQLDKIHMRRLLDDDQQEVRRLQELYLEDGELHSEGGGRQRQFRWKNLNNTDEFSENRGPSDDEALGEVDDGEDEQEWRRMRFERETFLQEHKDKVVTVETTEVDIAESLKLRLGRSQAHSQPLRLQTKRGSFLARSEAALARIAQLTRSTSDTAVLAPTNSRNFVFATLSPEKKGEDNFGKVVKRKAPSATLSVVKKPRLSEGLLDRLSY